MNRKMMLILVVLIIAAATIISLLAYPKVPDRMASHWGPGGQVDGWMNKTVGLFFAPLIMVGLTLMFLVILLIDPLRKNIDKFFSYYAGFIVIFNLFLLVVHGWTILWNAGIQIPANVFMPLAMACLFFYIGIVLTHVKPNWFIGIRTPWTLSSEIVWQKTHKLGGILFRIAAIIILLAAAFPKHTMWFILVPVFAVSAVTILYSLVIFKKLGKGSI
ncbi:MAG: SdpI family protein [Planctomycetaceae bacterium]|nr:SdpI family protein [Planctomycetaceae bacterium]